MDKIKTGVVGCGKVGDFHASSYSRLEESVFTAVYSRDRAKLLRFAEKYGVKPVRSIEEMAACGVEAVSICTPHPTHAECAAAALDAGMHVLVEKPFATTTADCDIILAAAAKNNKTAGVVCQRRFYPPCARIRSAVDDGKLGAPILGSVVMMGWRDEAYYKSDPWRGSRSGEGGGVLVNQAPHQLDLLLWYMGDAAEVYGEAVNFNHPYIEVEDTAVAVIKFRSGALGSVIVSNSQNPALYGKVHIFGSNGVSAGVQTDGGAMFIAGMTGIAEPPYNDIWTVPGEGDKAAAWRKEDADLFERIEPTLYFHDRQIENFLRSLAGREILLASGADGKKTVALFEGVYRAAETGKPQKLTA